MKKILTGLLVGTMLMLAVGSANAIRIPGPGWSDGDALLQFLALSYFPGSEKEISSLDFAGPWQYTAIGAESGNYNLVETNPSEGFGGTLGGTVTFTTSNTTNWGAWETIDFGPNNNLYFEDADNPFNVALDPFNGTVSPAGFKVFQLTEDSLKLDYLGNKITLKAGTYIIGFNDNSLSGNDGDYDDIIIAARAVPEPTTMLLLGLGLVGLAGMSRRFKK